MLLPFNRVKQSGTDNIMCSELATCFIIDPDTLDISGTSIEKDLVLYRSDEVIWMDWLMCFRLVLFQNQCPR